MKFFLAFLLAIFLCTVSVRAEEYSDADAGFSYTVPDDWVLRTVSHSKFKIAYPKEHSNPDGLKPSRSG